MAHNFVHITLTFQGGSRKELKNYLYPCDSLAQEIMVRNALISLDPALSGGPKSQIGSARSRSDPQTCFCLVHNVFVWFKFLSVPLNVHHNHHYSLCPACFSHLYYLTGPCAWFFCLSVCLMVCFLLCNLWWVYRNQFHSCPISLQTIWLCINWLITSKFTIKWPQKKGWIWLALPVAFLMLCS